MVRRFFACLLVLLALAAGSFASIPKAIDGFPNLYAYGSVNPADFNERSSLLRADFGALMVWPFHERGRGWGYAGKWSREDGAGLSSETCGRMGWRCGVRRVETG